MGYFLMGTSRPVLWASIHQCDVLCPGFVSSSMDMENIHRDHIIQLFLLLTATFPDTPSTATLDNQSNHCPY